MRHCIMTCGDCDWCATSRLDDTPAADDPIVAALIEEVREHRESTGHTAVEWYLVERGGP